MLIVDDLIATGGTARATADLVRHCGAEVVGICVLVDLINLHGDIGYPVSSLVEYTVEEEVGDAGVIGCASKPFGLMGEGEIGNLSSLHKRRYNDPYHEGDHCQMTTPLQPAQTIMEVRQTCTPRALVGSALDAFFIETDLSRDPMQDTRQFLRNTLASNPDARILFVGHRGCGKSTELNKFLAECRDRFFPITFSILDEMTRWPPAPKI